MGRAENWRLINLTGDTHPIHVHLDAFQIISRQPAVVELPEGGITDTGTRATVRIGQPAGDGIHHGLDANELGLKDTVRVNANEVAQIPLSLRPSPARSISPPPLPPPPPPHLT